jgi:hypothetical protein
MISLTAKFRSFGVKPGANYSCGKASTELNAMT